MKTMKNTLYTTLLLLATTFIGLSQNVDFKAANFKDDKDGLKKATDAIKKGDEFYAIANEAIFQVQSPGLNYALALQEYMVAQKFNPNNAQLNFKIGVCHANSTDPFKSIEYISKAISLDPNCDPFLNYYKGYSLQLQGKFDEAVSAYTDFETSYKKADNFSKFVTQRKNQCKYAKTAIANPIRAWVDNIPELSSPSDDIAPSISTDGSEMILTSNKPNGHKPNAVGEYDKDIYTSTMTDGKWSTPKPIKGNVNTEVDDVSNNLNYDGTKMLFHREVNGQFDIFESRLSGLDWSTPTAMHFQISSSKANEQYAAYSNDGWSVYFSRDNATRENGFDVMYSQMQSKIQKDFMAATMIPAVNSKFNDGPIYLHIDGETMYIASEGHESMGGYDIFVSKKVQGQWTKPVNMGYPINTPYDDFFFAPTANGKFAYIASNRDGGKGGFDIYKVTFWGAEKAPITETEDYLLASLAMPIKDASIEGTVEINKKSFTVFKGITIDAMTKKPVEASIEITDNGTGKIIETFTTNSATGKFIITLASGKNYGIAVKAEGYLFHSENFDIPQGSADNLVNKEIELKKIAIGSKIALRNIFFDTGKSTLRAESNAELDRLVKLLKDVPGLKIEISGHTDNTGSATLNETLSQARAEAVVTYLTSKGIQGSRLTAKGYGASKPVASNNNEDGRQQNRRTEFEIKGN
jgi:outer membrane protein OmpA-like peptidoglycan-associated protein/tetratricopeptide (TPR) repeat protein